MSELRERLIAEESELVFDRFTLDDAWALGVRLRTAAAEHGLPVAIAIWFGPQRVFHAALPGSSADNDGWLDRKHRVVERFGHASMLVGESFRADGGDFDADARLDPREYAARCWRRVVACCRCSAVVTFDATRLIDASGSMAGK
ncbi:heme-binding protein [Agromyces humi]|uniref:heme-binding protein n=1 Tax=Agromyces humi TaxID=1766800 RepID=UPI0013567F5C|nr:heme-binding protein [Agromyces humi]